MVGRETETFMFDLKLDRPLAVLDIEATGTAVRADRVVELAVLRLEPDGQEKLKTWRVNPGVPIPHETTLIHGISDADVANCPRFPDIVNEVDQFLAGCDLAGYNLGRFDIPMLQEEFLRCGKPFDVEGRRVIDAQTIFHRREPRDLTAALAFYCGELHVDAHGAEGDVRATLRVLQGQIKKYPDLPRDMDQLHELCNPRDPRWVDRVGRLKWSAGEVVLNFGKKKGVKLRTLIKDDPNFVKWLLRSDFPRDMQETVANALEGKWPKPPPGGTE